MAVAARHGTWIPRAALGLAAWLWVALLVLAPAALAPIGALICHQRPERSFFIGGTQIPVCARCTGLYAGAALGVLVAAGGLLAQRPYGRTIAAPLPSDRARRIFVIAALPTAVTWMLEAAGLVPFSNAVRFAAGLPLGLAAAWLVLAVIGEPVTASDHEAPRPSV